MTETSNNQTNNQTNKRSNQQISTNDLVTAQVAGATIEGAAGGIVAVRQLELLLAYTTLLNW